MIERIHKIILYMVVVLLPLFVTTLLLHFVVNSNILHYQPVWTDEVDYWLQINSFKEVGFSNGFFSINELTSNSSFSHYGTHGPMFPILYGSIARIFGWFYYSGPLFNLLLVSLSLLIFLCVTRPDRKQTILVILFLLFFYQLHLYIPTTMQESLNTSFAILFSAFFIRLIIFHDKRLQNKIGVLLLITIASLFRIIWIFTIFPIIYSFFNDQKPLSKKLIYSIIGGLLFSIFMVIIYNYWTSPYPSGFIFQITNGELNIHQLTLVELRLILSNLKKLFGINLPIIETEIYIRYLYLLVIFILALSIKKNQKTYISILYILVSTLVITILIYDIGNFRILAPLLLFCLFSLPFASDQFTMKYVLISYLFINLLTIGNFISNYQYFHINHFAAENNNSLIKQKNILNEIKYTDSNNPWCNSLLTDQIFTRDLLNTPAGIGVNVLKDLKDDKLEIKSHYLLVTYDILAINGIVSTCQTLGTYSDYIICERVNDNCNYSKQ